ncbi:MAG: hypothetical protein ACD_62C00247G0003 [uncultured bacterium]|nr:MAG: hypothetical protein ACD_62C00247G0003 [uncultured bacterium]
MNIESISELCVIIAGDTGSYYFGAACGASLRAESVKK